jgi:hypothetical protein
LLVILEKNIGKIYFSNSTNLATFAALFSRRHAHCTLNSTNFSVLLHAENKKAVLTVKLYQPRAASIRTAVALAHRCKLPSSGGDTGLHSYVFKSLSSPLQNTLNLYNTIFLSCIYCRALSVFEPSESEAIKLAMPSFCAISLVKSSPCRFAAFRTQFFHNEVQRSHEIISLSPQM